MSDGSQEVKSSVAFEEITSKDLDYDFICFFLSSPRVDLYRSLDLRCEDMLLGMQCHLRESILHRRDVELCLLERVLFFSLLVHVRTPLTAIMNPNFWRSLACHEYGAQFMY